MRVDWRQQAEQMAGLMAQIEAGDAPALERGKGILWGLLKMGDGALVLLLLDALREEYLRNAGAQES